MASPLDPKELVTVEDLAISSMWEVAALVEVWERKGVLTRQERHTDLLNFANSSCEIPPPPGSSVFKQRWAELIKKVYEAEPLVCRRCADAMRIIAFIDQREVIEKILTHLRLWPHPSHAPPPSAVAFFTFLHRLTASLRNRRPCGGGGPLRSGIGEQVYRSTSSASTRSRAARGQLPTGAGAAHRAG